MAIAPARARQSALRQMRARPKTAHVPTPPPVGGWNARDALTAMPPTDAVTLDNFYPDSSKVTTRKGYSEHATGVGAAAVETLFEYNGASGRVLLAASSTALYDATSAGAATSLKTSLSNGRWQGANFNDNALLVNGEDTPQVFDGSALSNSTITGSGLTAANLIGVNVHKSRVYVWESASQDFWYGATNAIGGTFTKFPLSRISQTGGTLTAMGTWTVDGGAGVDDLAVFLMSSGEAIVYQGSDPGDASAWSIVGRFQIGAPLGIRALTKVGADLMVATRDDYVSMSQALTKARVNVPENKIRPAIIAAAAATGGNFGWDMAVFPSGGFLIVNVPTSGGDFDQHVQNLVTKAWCRFKDVPANCWAMFNDRLYFGGAGGKVYRFWDGNDDDGAAISADGLGAWVGMGGAGRKRAAAVRPVMGATGGLTYSFGLGVDYRTPGVSDPTTISSTGTPWGSPWGSPWSPENTITAAWRAVAGTGDVFAPRLRVSSTKEVSWYRTDYRVERSIGL